MASTISAAASMLLSGAIGSSASHSTSLPSTTTSTLPHGLNFFLSDGSNNKSKQVYITNPSLSSSPSHPTITLDLTSHPPPPSSSSPFLRFASNPNQPRSSYPSSTSLSFGTNSFTEPNAITIPWSTSNETFLNYGTVQQSYHNKNMNPVFSSLSFGRSQPMLGNMYQYSNNVIQKNNNLINRDTISAATKAITTDPTFQSALAAALTTFIGGGGGGSQGIGGEKKWGEMFPSSLLNKSSASGSPATENNSDNNTN